MNRMLWLLVFWLICAAINSQARDIGTIGATYRIAERNGTDVLRERAARVDWTAMFDSAGRRALEVQPADMRKLPRVRTSSKRTVDMTYTIEEDVPDFKDPTKVMYPKGFKFNPLEYMPAMNLTFVFIDASDKRQVAWLKKSGLADQDGVTLMVTGGNATKLIRSGVGTKVYYAGGKLLDRFGVKAVPSIVKQVGVEMEVAEIEIPRR